MRKFNFSTWAVTRSSLTLLVMILVTTIGLFSYLDLNRSEDPEIESPMLSIIVPWPGATAEQIEAEIIDPLEKSLNAVGDIDFIRSFSRQGSGGLIILLEGGTAPKKVKERWDEVNKKVDQVKRKFPKGVGHPQVSDQLTNIYSRIYALTGEGFSARELHQVARRLQKELMQNEHVAQVDVLGGQPDAIYVEFNATRLAALGLSPSIIAASIQRHNQVIPSGVTVTPQDQLYFRVNSKLTSLQSIENIPIKTFTGVVLLRDIAQVTVAEQAPRSFGVRYNGKPAVMLAILKRKNSSIFDLGTTIDQNMPVLSRSIPEGMALTKFTDQPTIVKASIWEFERSFIEAALIVLVISFLALGLRAGLVVALSIPFVFSIVAVVMHQLGWPLNRVSLGALIIALGLLVDDAIIAVEMMMTRIELGCGKLRAAGHAYATTAFPMLTGTLITVAGFLPVGLAKSNAGHYSNAVFWVLLVTLLASWVVAIWFTPFIGQFVLKQKGHSAEFHDPYQTVFYAWLRRWIHTILRYRWTVVLSTLAIFIFTMWLSRFIPQQFFPASTRQELIVTLSLKQGASFDATTNEVKVFEQLIANNPRVAKYSSFIGRNAPRFFLSMPPDLPNLEQGQIVVVAKSFDDVMPLKADIEKILNNPKYFSASRTRVTQLDFGPPVGATITFWVYGNNPEDARALARKVQAAMQKSPLLKEVSLGWDAKVRALHVDVDHYKLARYGIKASEVNQAIQATMSGLPVSQFTDDDQRIPIVLRASEQDRKTLDLLDWVRLSAANGQSIPLSAIAQIKPTYEEPVIWRQSGKVFIDVTADLNTTLPAPEVSKMVDKEFITAVRQTLAPGQKIVAGGAIYESVKSNKAVLAVVPLMMFVITILVMQQLQNVRGALVVLCTAPLGLVGVVPIMLLTQSAFGFIALVGVVALTGMIMRNTIILVDQISLNLRQKMTLRTAIAEASVRRVRPVLITATTAIVAMIPLAQSVFWGPMAIAIMGGLTVATLFTIIVEPTLYYILHRPKYVSLEQDSYYPFNFSGK